jgi:hypothetical protein
VEPAVFVINDFKDRVLLIETATLQTSIFEFALKGFTVVASLGHIRIQHRI